VNIVSAIALLFLVLDPVGNIPVFLTVLKNVEGRRHTRIILRELCFALGVLIIFLFSGSPILRILSITEPSLSIAGGIIIFLIAIKMIFPVPEGIFGKIPEGEPFIVPLAIPLIAGPSAITTLLLLISREPSRWLEWLVALFCAWLLSGVILLASAPLHRFLGERVLIAVERIMGMLLTTVAVQMFLSGLKQVILQ